MQNPIGTTIHPLVTDDKDQLIAFANEMVGDGYISDAEWKFILKKSQNKGYSASFLAKDLNNHIIGMRLTYAPDTWIESFEQGFLTQNLWQVNAKELAYFKSLFIHPQWQKKGLGTALSNGAIEVLKKMGAKAVLCHSWNESPSNSSYLYLNRLGFKELQNHPNYWADDPHLCTRCKSPPCCCSSTEMILYL